MLHHMLRAAAGSRGDPFWDNVSALLHFDGADGSTTFTDETGRSWTPYGNAQIDTAQSVFGGASALFDGTGDYISTPYSTDLQFGTSDFVVEYRIRPGNVSSGQIHIDWRNDTYEACYIAQTGASPDKISFLYNTGPSTNTIALTSTTALSVGVWHAVAIERSGGTLSIYIDGAQEDTFAISGGNITDGESPTYIGATSSGAAELNAHLDELRITKGVSRYSGNYTPENQPFPDR